MPDPNREAALQSPAPAASLGWRLAGWLLFAVAFLQYTWNAFTITPLTGYDGPAHAGYIATIAMDGRLPLPREGWSTFHPPLYYLVSACIWQLFDGWGPRGLTVAIRAVSTVAIFVSAAVLRWLLIQRGVSPGGVWVAVALALFIPASQFAGTFVGNEAFGVLWASLSIAAILRLQRDPSDSWAAVIAGACAGLAMATKYTGLFVALGCLVPFARSSAWPAARRTLPWMLIALGLLGGPTYARNIALTGSPVPMTRDSGFHAQVEESMTLRPRAWRDYGPPPFEAFSRPILFHVDGPPEPGIRWNEAMQNVWGQGYATIWYDAAGNRRRVAADAAAEGIFWGRILVGLGLLPTLLMIAGFAAALRESWRTRLASPDSPLVVVGIAGLALYVAFTLRAPAIVAAKGSYLLPLLVPAGIFFTSALERMPAAARIGSLFASAAAALVAAYVFTTFAVFGATPPDRMLQFQTVLDRVYPTAHVARAVEHMLPQPKKAPPRARTRVRTRRVAPRGTTAP